jgi:hypothetical protein
MLVEMTEEDRSPAHAPPAVVGGLDLQVLVLERAADEERAAVPRDAAVLVDASDVGEGVELWLDERSRISASRRRVDSGWRSQLQCFVRSVVVVLAAPGVEDTLLRSQVARRWRCRLVLQGPVQSLEPSILLRLAGGDDLDADGELEEPHRELCEASRAVRGEWRAAIGANRCRQSIDAPDVVRPLTAAERRRDARRARTLTCQECL